MKYLISKGQPIIVDYSPNINLQVKSSAKQDLNSLETASGKPENDQEIKEGIKTLGQDQNAL